MIKCSAIGQRGGRCRRNAERDPFTVDGYTLDGYTLDGYTLDFCAAHNQQVRDGKSVHCAKCGGTVATS